MKLRSRVQPRETSTNDDRGECSERPGQGRQEIGETHQPVEVHDILSKRRDLGECAVLRCLFSSYAGKRVPGIPGF